MRMKKNAKHLMYCAIFDVWSNKIGASIVGRLGSWLGTIAVSLQGALGMVYIGEILLKSVPFTRCEVCIDYETTCFCFSSCCLLVVEHFLEVYIRNNNMWNFK